MRLLRYRSLKSPPLAGDAAPTYQNSSRVKLGGGQCPPYCLKERNQPIDGINNLDYWTGKSEESSRDHYLYYYESSIKAIRYKQWKIHFETSERYYDTYQKQKFPVFFNLHFDPFESFDGITDRSDVVQRKQWLNEPVQHILGEHIKSLSKYPPVQKAASFDFSELIKQMQAGQQ